MSEFHICNNFYFSSSKRNLHADDKKKKKNVPISIFQVSNYTTKVLKLLMTHNSLLELHSIDCFEKDDQQPIITDDIIKASWLDDQAIESYW